MNRFIDRILIKGMLAVGLGALAGMLSGCSSAEEVDFYPAEEGALTLRLSETNVTLNAAMARAEVSVQSNSRWSVCDPNDLSWLSFEYTSEPAGTGNGSFAIIAADNFANEVRKATLEVSGPTKSETINITQTGLTIYISPQEIEAAPEGGVYTVIIRCNSQWTASCLESWVSLSKNEGDGTDESSEIQVTVDNNLASASTRTARIFITSPQGIFENSDIDIRQTGIPAPVMELPVVSNRSKTGATVTAGYICQAAVVEKGVYYSQVEDFDDTSGRKVVDSGDTADMISCEISGLSQGSTYYVRSFVKTAGGVTLSEAVRFETTGRTPDSGDNPLPQ